MELFLSKLTNILDEIPVNLYVYDYDSATMFAMRNGTFSPVSLPEAMRKPLTEKNIFVSHFKKSNKLFSFYYLKITFHNKNITLVYQDDDKKSGLSDFVALCSAVNSKLIQCQPQESDTNIQNIVNVNNIAELENKIDELKESVQVLKASRNKFFKMVDSVCFPFFSVASDYTLNNVNGRAAQMAGVERPARIFLKNCHSTIYQELNRCQWCKYEEVVSSKKAVIQTIQTGNDHEYFRHAMIPIIDDEGNVEEVAELLFDYNEEAQTAIDYSALKKQYINLFNDHDKAIEKTMDISEKYSKLNSEKESMALEIESHIKKEKKYKLALTRLMQEDAAHELVEVRAENKELNNKLQRATVALRNYQESLKNSDEKYKKLSQTAVYQTERVINTLNTKNILNKDDVQDAISQISEGIQLNKLYLEKLIKKDEKLDSK